MGKNSNNFENHQYWLSRWQNLQNEWLNSGIEGNYDNPESVQIFDRMLETEKLLAATPAKTPEEIIAQLQYLKDDMSMRLHEVDSKWVDLINTIQSKISAL